MFQRASFETEALETRALRESDGQERWDKAVSGRWQCVLRVVTPLCIKTEFDRQARLRPKGATIPGSSLRGMVRNTAEILGAGCGRFYGGGRELPAGISPCQESALCLVCRVFGFVSGSTTWQSRVRFTDATAETARWDKLLVEGRGGSGGGEPERKTGWALFVHKEENHAHGNVPCVMPPTEFAFRVEHQNLDATELAVFRLALTLQASGQELLHKLGFAKSQGLGSCKIRIAQGEANVDPARRDEVARETARYAQMEGYRELTRWRTEKA